MRRPQFETYLDKVFAWTASGATRAEGRQNPPPAGPKVFDAGFLGSAGQFGPVHRIEAEGKDGVLEKRIGSLSEDTIGYALQRQSPEEVFALGCRVARQLKRNGVLHADWARERVVAAVDGIEICSSYCRCCEACLERTVKRKVDGEREEWTQYYHRLSAVTVVSTPFPIFRGVRFQKSGETEGACSLARLKELGAHLGKRFVDILVADALYLQTPFVQALESRGREWVINLQDNQPDWAAEAELLTNRPADCRDASAQGELRLWHLPEVDGPVADRLVGVGKTVRVQNANRVVVRKQDGQPIKEKQPAPIVSTNSPETHSGFSEKH